MNTNTTQTRFFCFCMEAERLQARAKAATSSNEVQPVPRSSDKHSSTRGMATWSMAAGATTSQCESRCDYKQKRKKVRMPQVP